MAVHTAQGKESPTPSQYLEKGAATHDSATRIDIPALYPRERALYVYEQMTRNDAQIRAALRACKTPVLGGQWYVEAAGDSQDDKDAAEFVEYNLFHAMSITWSQVLEETLTMLDYGSSVFETVFEEREWRPAEEGRNTRNFIFLKKLAPRPQTTINRYLYDKNGGPAGVMHQFTDQRNPDSITTSSNGLSVSKEVEIGIDKLVIFTYDKRGGNLEGNSILRSAYKHWYFKDQLYKIDAIQKERHGIGVPDIGLPPGYDDGDLQYAAELGRNLRTNERAYILRPPGWEVGFAKPEGNLVNALESAREHDLLIARNVLAQFINSGSHDMSGSRASSATMFDLFLKSLRSVGNLVADTLNQFLVHKLVDYNFDVDRYPEIRVRRIGENRDLQQFSNALRNMIEVNVVTPDDSLEEWIRNEFDMPTTFKRTQPRLPGATRTQILEQGTLDPATNPGLAKATTPGTAPGGNTPNTASPGRPQAAGNQGKGPQQSA